MKSLIWLLLFSPVLLLGQHNEEQISNADIDTFIKVFFQSKTIRINHDSLIIATLKEVGLSSDRYGQILRASIDGSKIELSSNENAALKMIAEKVQEQKTHQEEAIKKACLSYDMKIETYQRLERKFRTDPQFQHSLKEKMQTYIIEK